VTSEDHQELHDLLVRLDEAINGERTGLKAVVGRLETKLDGHFTNHKRERNAILAAMSTAILSLVGMLYAVLVG